MSRPTVVLTVRVAPDLGAALTARAITEGVSVNALVEGTLREAMEAMEVK